MQGLVIYYGFSNQAQKPNYRKLLEISIEKFQNFFFSSSTNNYLLALAARKVTADFELPMDDFCPKREKIIGKAESSGPVSIKLKIPERSTIISVVRSLYRNAHFMPKIPHIQMSSVSGAKEVSPLTYTITEIIEKFQGS